MKPKNSFLFPDGKTYVDCSECIRGGNGKGQDKCIAGWYIKRTGRGGCFGGILLDQYEQPDLIDKVPIGYKV